MRLCKISEVRRFCQLFKYTLLKMTFINLLRGRIATSMLVLSAAEVDGWDNGLTAG